MRPAILKNLFLQFQEAPEHLADPPEQNGVAGTFHVLRAFRNPYQEVGLEEIRLKLYPRFFRFFRLRLELLAHQPVHDFQLERQEILRLGEFALLLFQARPTHELAHRHQRLPKQPPGQVIGFVGRHVGGVGTDEQLGEFIGGVRRILLLEITADGPPPLGHQGGNFRGLLGPLFDPLLEGADEFRLRLLPQQPHQKAVIFLADRGEFRIPVHSSPLIPFFDFAVGLPQ